MKTTWRNEIEKACVWMGDSLETLTIKLRETEHFSSLDHEHSNVYLGALPTSLEFFAWSENYVYFSMPLPDEIHFCVRAVPRNPGSKYGGFNV